jgi:cell division protein FtsI/penicillin-binding protein 2
MTSSPLQLAVATAALANQGVIIQPKLLKSIPQMSKPVISGYHKEHTSNVKNRILRLQQHWGMIFVVTGDYGF